MKILNAAAMAALAICLMAGTASADLLTNGGFESTGTWITFGNTFYEPAPGLDPPFEGNQSLKMFGNFSGSENFAGAFQDIAVDGTNVAVGDLIQLSGYIAQLSGDALAGQNTAFFEITFVDAGNNEFGFGANKTADFNSASPIDSWEFRITDGVFVPVEAVAVRAKAVFVQQADAAGGAAWFENLALENITAIPEPGSALALGLFACVGLLHRRKRS